MSLLDDLRDVATTIFEAFGTQEGTIRFRKVARTAGGSNPAAPYATSTATNVDIATGANVKRVSVYSQKEGSPLKAGDLIIEVPGDQITEAQIKNATVYYPYTGAATDPKYSVQNYRPKTLPGGAAILDGGVVMWQIIAQLEK
jgi:hypothetical protein